MIAGRLILRKAETKDAEGIAQVLSLSFELLNFLPKLHTAEENHWFIENVILKDCEVTVVECDNVIVSFLAQQDQEIRLLYTLPNFIGRGAGSRLLVAAKSSGAPALELWCFQENTKARRFYETRGFRAIEFTNGERNEERTPDVRYRWDRSAS